MLRRILAWVLAVVVLVGGSAPVVSSALANNGPTTNTALEDGGGKGKKGKKGKRGARAGKKRGKKGAKRGHKKVKPKASA
jgi:hypothetical protein